MRLQVVLQEVYRESSTQTRVSHKFCRYAGLDSWRIRSMFKSMKRFVKIAVIMLVFVTSAVFILNRTINGVTIEYSQLPERESKVAKMLDDVYMDIVATKSYRKRGRSFYVIMRFAPNRVNRAGDIINLSGIIARQTRENLTDNQLKVEELQRRRAL